MLLARQRVRRGRQAIDAIYEIMVFGCDEVYHDLLRPLPSWYTALSQVYEMSVPLETRGENCLCSFVGVVRWFVWALSPKMDEKCELSFTHWRLNPFTDGFSSAGFDWLKRLPVSLTYRKTTFWLPHLFSMQSAWNVQYLVIGGIILQLSLCLFFLAIARGVEEARCVLESIRPC